MSMAPNVYCPLCGVVLLPDPYSNDYGEEPAWQSHARPWYAEVRGLYSTDVTTGNVTTTGLGIVRGRNILCAPLRSDQSYAGAEPMALGEWRLFGSSVVRWCFGFHDSCWKLLLLRLAHGSDEASLSEADVAESVFYQLYCTPCIDGSIFQFGHDYDGAAQTHKSFGQPNAVNLRSHLYADPCAIPSLKELERTASDFRKICGSWLWKDRDGAYPTTAAAADTDCHSKEGTSASGSFGPSDRYKIVSLGFGEMANHLETLKSSHSQSVRDSSRVSTNYGRTATFAHLRYRLNAAVEFIPISPPGNTITGLVAVEMVSPTRFKRIGIQSQECGKQPEIPDILDYECHQIPDDELRYDEKFSRFINSTNPGNYHTYASLKNIRRIQASTGIYGRSRSSNCISGLKFEYYNHPSPGIVGQWMHELNDGFELSEDEDIQSLTIWLVPTGFSTECQGIEVGQVAAIHIETTCSRSVTFRPPDFQSIPSQTLQHHQYQGDFDEKLTAISWILNLSCERVRAVISRNTSRRTSQILVPEQETPFDQVRKLYFERQNDDGCRDTIITAEAYFKDRAIVGLVFIYASGHTASTGDLHTKTRQTVHFAPDAQIVRLSAVVANTDHKLLEIEFEVGRNEQHRYEKLGLPANISHDLGHIVSCYWRETQCKDDASAEDYQRFSVSERVYKPPNGSRLVGIYMCCQEFSRVGALYELGVSP
ncbi:uncharacterized protein N7479_010569 [Penicillium vulpinum]|uniref:uncharacterized protein n=1 Tax=Penicillium vulpinum TaxID=29845 RepID=UPI002546BB0E|nr:uncharacterized protein N7479_010569 [Penicillium vulpinum]KAJ5952156.1 hypothetical protein N7479_010569 [Penicillium vulpinum]